MKLYISLGNLETESWIKNMLPSSTSVARSVSGADVVVTTKSADVKKCTAQKKVVVFVTATSTEAQRAESPITVIVPEQGIHPAHILDAVLPLLYPDAPLIQVAPEPFRIKVVSARQTGGTFFAWNLAWVLHAHGLPVQLIAAKQTSPIHTWAKHSEIPVCFGIERAGKSAIWIIDASDLTETEMGNIEAETEILIKDCDPAKSTPKVKKAWTVLNRVPLDFEVPNVNEWNLIIDDLGGIVYKSIAESMPVAAHLSPFEKILWDFWEAINQERREFHQEVYLEDETVHKNSQIDNGSSLSNQEEKTDDDAVVSFFDFKDESDDFSFDT